VWGELGPSYADVVAVDVCTGDAGGRADGNRGSSADVRRRACVPFSAAGVLGVVLCWASCWASCSRVVLQQGGGSCGSLRAGSAASRVGEGSDRRQRALHGKSLGIKHR
jgi:hypothetical protein